MPDTLLLDARNPADVERAETLLSQGKLVAVPTETVYGLAADADNSEAVEQIYAAKNRPADHPLIVHIGRVEDLETWAVDIPDIAYHLVKLFWPGPLTLVLNKNPAINNVVTGGLDTIALRMPAHPVLLDLLKKTGLGLAAPSANPYGQLSPTSAEQVMATMKGKVHAVLDGRQCEIGLESTIVDPRSIPLRILRSGPITASQLRNATGLEVITPKKHIEAVPGNVATHYKPNAALKLVDKATLLERLPTLEKQIACLVYSTEFDAFNSDQIKRLVADRQAYAKQLYRSIYELDKPQITEIWVETPPTEEDWLDVNDRLARASASG